MKDFLAALAEGKEFDWISNHGHELSKADLITIIKELLCAIHKLGIFDDKDDILQIAYEELYDMYGGNENEER